MNTESIRIQQTTSRCSWSGKLGGQASAEKMNSAVSTNETL